MKDQDKTKEQLINDLKILRKKVAELIEVNKRTKPNEVTLRENEVRFQRFSEAAFEGIAVHEKGKIIDANLTYAKLFGHELSEVIGKNVTEFIPPEGREIVLKNILSGYEKPYEGVGIKIDGAIFPIEICGKAIAYKGRIASVIAIRDITEQKRVEEALRNSEERFRDLFDNAPDIYIILDPQGTVLDFNQRGLNKLGYQVKEIIGKPITDFKHPEDIAKVEAVITNIHKSGTPPKNIEVRFIHKNGDALWVSNEFSLLKSEEGELKAIRVVCRDITENKRLQRELARAQRLETAGRVASQIAHDLNNLLAPLTAYPTLIREDLPSNHPVLELVVEMESAANKIAEINQQLLALGRRGHYTMELIDLNDLVQKVILSQHLPNEIVLREELASDLLLIKGGVAQLTRALTNLINNAKEAMQDMGNLMFKTENVYLDKPLRGYQTIERGEYVKLNISDTGTGIAPEILDKIFDPFFTTKKMDRMRGSGLGLSVVHGIMEDINGYITVESTLGQGTTFSLYFPVSRGVESEIPEFFEKSKGGNERILVVDDDPVQRRVASQILERMGYEVNTVSSGEQAVNYVKKHPQDLLLLDMVMNGIDGAETLRRILEFQPEQKAIIFSGYAMSQRVQEALRLGAGTFVSKPVTLNALASAVRSELDKNRKK
ncbi:MAG: PAS domain S-box protein [bacterium]